MSIIIKIGHYWFTVSYPDKESMDLTYCLLDANRHIFNKNGSLNPKYKICAVREITPFYQQKETLVGLVCYTKNKIIHIQTHLDYRWRGVGSFLLNQALSDKEFFPNIKDKAFSPKLIFKKCYSLEDLNDKLKSFV